MHSSLPVNSICSRSARYLRRSFTAALHLTLIFATNASQAAPVSSYALDTDEWQQLVIPGDSTNSTIESLFADDLPSAQYNSTWVIYRWDANQREYVNPGISGSIPTGSGFWIIQRTGAPVTLDVPDIGQAPVQSSTACSSPSGCTDIPLISSDSADVYNMLGSALPINHDIDSIRLVSDASSGVCSTGCDHNLAANNNLVNRAIWRYEPSIGEYQNLSQTGLLKSWESAWFSAKSELGNTAASYLFPVQEVTSDPGECLSAPALPPLAVSDPGKTIVQVSTEAQLQNALSNLSANTVVLIDPGTYELSSTLWIQRDNVTVRGNSDSCNDIKLVGMGMENAAGLDSVPHGVWTNADNVKIQNLAIESVYYHPIAIDPLAQSPQIYNVLMLDAGEQFVKVSSSNGAGGSNNGRVEYSVMKYTDAPPVTDHGGGIGYTQGVDIHSGSNWLVSNNLFQNFHTPDNADHLWSPVVLAWNYASNTVVENNVFIDVDRAIAFGLANRANDHSGGIIRNNVVMMSEGLYSAQRTSGADAPIIVWNSPGSEVLHNTVLTNGNTPFAIQLRFNSNAAIVRNNLIDAPVHNRSNIQFTEADNIVFDDPSIFVDAAGGDLHLISETNGVTNAVPALSNAPTDIDGQNRNSSMTDAGADEFRP